MTWQQWQNTVIELLQVYGWRVHHGRPAMTSRGWRTPIQGSPGFPDAIAVHLEQRRMIVVELKTGRGKVSPDQEIWLDYFRSGSGCEVYIWKPEDWDTIVEIVQGGKNASQSR